jgi:hypothetical protein
MNLTESYQEYINEKFMSAVKALTSGKKKYAKYSDIKSKMDASDDDFNAILKGALKSNRHSNKLIFTEIDDEPAVGITAGKRKRKAKEEFADDEVELLDEPETNEDVNFTTSVLGESIVPGNNNEMGDLKNLSASFMAESTSIDFNPYASYKLEEGREEARELDIFIDNDRAAYDQKWNAYKKLAKFKEKGTYSTDKAIKLMMYVVDFGAKKYVKDYDAKTSKWNYVFPKKDRMEVAKGQVAEFEGEYDMGNITEQSHFIQESEISADQKAYAYLIKSEEQLEWEAKLNHRTPEEIVLGKK